MFLFLQCFSGYTNILDFIHFFEVNKNLLPAQVQSAIHFLTMEPFVLLESGNGREMRRTSRRQKRAEGESGRKGSSTDYITLWASKQDTGKEGGMEREGGGAVAEATEGS